MRECVSGCWRQPAAPMHASKSRVEKGCWKPKPMPRGCPLHLPSGAGAVAALPQVVLVCKALMQAWLLLGHPGTQREADPNLVPHWQPHWGQ